MHLPRLALVAALAAVTFTTPTFAEEVRVTSDGPVIAFEGNPTRLRVRHDRAAGKLVFHLAEPTQVLRDPPVVLLRTAGGTQEATLVQVPGEPGAWVITHAALREERYDGTVRIVVDGKTYTAPLAAPTATKVPAPRYQGRVIAFSECSLYAELVEDPATGTVTLYPVEGTRIESAPTIAVTLGERSSDMTFVTVEGQAGVWRLAHPTLKGQRVAGKIRILANGRTCYAVLRGGEIVRVANGPSFEVVYDRSGKTATFYALEETYEGRPYVIEQPRFVYTTHEGPRTVVLTPVSGEPRAWRAVGLDAGVMHPGDAMLRFTLLGRELETRVGLSGLGLGLR